ncbi:MAG: tRNA glutamyl-Q(34) synthetase GluQRS [Myxococcales bacterium]
MAGLLDIHAGLGKVRGRYAPSPTGALHVGNARTALLAWLQIRTLGGAFVMRIEDLDRARNVKGGVEALLDDLKWLGLDWDEGPDPVGGPCAPYEQTRREAIYEAALARLSEQGRIFECFCSRQEIAAAASAPHGPQDDGPRYPGTCLRLGAAGLAPKRATGRKAALRFVAKPGAMTFEDGLHGRVTLDVAETVGDFVVRRADGIHAYQLAVSVDDALMGITHVLRGDDLLTSTPRQLQILEALGLPAPRYFHVPLMIGADGQRLSKRKGDINLAWLREHGVKPQRLVAELARTCGLTDAKEIEPRELVRGFDLAKISRTPAGFDASRLG